MSNPFRFFSYLLYLGSRALCVCERRLQHSMKSSNQHTMMLHKTERGKNVTDYQPYDSALKSLMGEEGAEILPHFLPEAEYLSEQNIEIDRTALKADLVYNIKYQGEPLILNMELQTDADVEMPLLKYHVGLYEKHRRPVISMVLYLFETSVPTPPFQEKVGEKALLTLEYVVIALWMLDAGEYVEQHILCMYTFLPAMKGVSVSLLVQAVKEMEAHYNREQFAQHFTRFKTILHRSTMLSEQDKQEVEEHLYSYNSLLDNDPEIQEHIAKAADKVAAKIVAEAVAEAEAKAAAKLRTEAKAEKAEAEVRVAQKIIVGFVEARFPTLKELAQERVALVESPEALSLLVKQVAVVPDESAARWLLGALAA